MHIRKFALGAIAAAVLACPVPASAAGDAGPNVVPPSPGFDQTVTDIDKVEWSPLDLEGLKGAEIAVLRGSLEKGGVEALLRFPAGFKVPNHSHASDETYVWLQGPFTLISFKGERTRFDGPAFISFPGNAPPHGLECGPYAPCILYVRYGRPFNVNFFPEPPAAR